MMSTTTCNGISHLSLGIRISIPVASATVTREAMILFLRAIISLLARLLGYGTKSSAYGSSCESEY